MKRLSFFSKTQLILLTFVVVWFGLEANLRQINTIETCLQTGTKQVCTTSSHLEKIKSASDQTVRFVKIMVQLFVRNEDRP